MKTPVKIIGGKFRGRVGWVNGELRQPGILQRLVYMRDEKPVVLPLKHLREVAESFAVKCPGGIDPGFEECPRCGADVHEDCKQGVLL